MISPGTAMPIRVAIVEDNPHYRASLEALFSSEEGFEVGEVFDSPLAFLDAARGETAPWGLVLMDIELPEMSGIEATRRIKDVHRGLPVVALTVFEEPSVILQAICAGADGYLLKKTPASELVAMIRTVAEGGSPLTPAVARGLLDVVRRAGPGPAVPGMPLARLELSEREQQLLRCLVKGRSYKEAADEMCVSIDTVRTYIRRIYRKLQVHSVGEAISRALRDGLV
jgi:DNA-binding NarL/FixJ family response regulator